MLLPDQLARYLCILEPGEEARQEMAKVSKTAGRFTPEQVQLFLQQGEIKTMADVQSALKDLFGFTGV